MLAGRATSCSKDGGLRSDLLAAVLAVPLEGPSTLIGSVGEAEAQQEEAALGRGSSAEVGTREVLEILRRLPAVTAPLTWIPCGPGEEAILPLCP